MRYDTIPAGTYVGTVTGSALGTAKTGNEQIAIAFDVHVEDPETGAPCSIPMTWFGFFTEAALQTTDKALAALGFDPTTRDIVELNPDEPHLTPIAGVEADLVLEHEQKEDGSGTKLRIRWVNRRGGGIAMKDRMEPTQAKAFGAQLRARLIASRGPGAAPAAKPAAPAQRTPAAPPARAPAARPAQQRPAAAPARAPAPQPAAADPQGIDFSDVPFLWFVVAALSTLAASGVLTA